MNVVVDDQVFCKLQVRDQVAYTGAWEDGDMRLCGFSSTRHFCDTHKIDIDIYIDI